MKYLTESIATCRRLSFDANLEASKIKSQREDFNDLFQAEAECRLEAGDQSLVFVLTYNDENIPQRYGCNLVDAEDLKVFSKSSWWSKRLLRTFGMVFDFVCVGEYGEGGETHNYHGKRGKGRNPHFHCVGWFHRVAPADYVAAAKWFKDLKDEMAISPKDYINCIVPLSVFDSPRMIEINESSILPLLVRIAWQGNVIDNVYAYAASKFSRMQGNGRVQLDGPILCSAAGGSYISKYIGKDIRRMFHNTFKKGFCPSTLAYMIEEVQPLCHMPRVMFTKNELIAIIYLWSKQTKVKDHYLFNRWLEQQNPEDAPQDVVANVGYLGDLFASLDCSYMEHYEDFYKDINGRYSPKVRKFHGFGYSLMKYADVDNGTYIIPKAKGAIERNLPPSLIRHFYYDFNTYTNKFGQKVVKYSLNTLGRDLHLKKLNDMYEKNSEIIRALGSQELKENAIAVNNFATYLSLYDINTKNFCSSVYDTCIAFQTCALDYHMKFISEFAMCDDMYILQANGQTYLQECICEDRRTFVDCHQYVKHHHPAVYRGYQELMNIKSRLRNQKNLNDQQHLEHWSKVYNFNY